jgi:hypothetical protein
MLRNSARRVVSHVLFTVLSIATDPEANVMLLLRLEKPMKYSAMKPNGADTTTSTGSYESNGLNIEDGKRLNK